MGASVFGGVLAGVALPYPEVRPGGGELCGIGASTGFGFEDFGEFGIGFLVLESGHTGGAEPSAAFGTGKAFFNFPADARGYESHIHFRVAAEVAGDHFLLNAAAGFGAEEKSAVSGFSERALATFVRTADQIAGRIKCHREIPVDPVITNG